MQATAMHTNGEAGFNAGTAPGAAADPGGRRMPRTVIIVDENLLCARVYKAMLQPLACRVLVARTAEDAARLVRLHPDDEEAGGATRASDATGDHAALPGAEHAPPPLFVVTAARQAAPVQAAARSAGGAAIVVRKPVAGDGLANLVRRHLTARP